MKLCKQKKNNFEQEQTIVYLFIFLRHLKQESLVATEFSFPAIVHGESGMFACRDTNFVIT